MASEKVEMEGLKENGKLLPRGIFITGASGFIGVRLVKYLVKRIIDEERDEMLYLYCRWSSDLSPLK
jgi:hypothetical protein